VAWKHVALVGVTFQSAETLKGELQKL
jgi:hypothetical protein